MKPTEGFGSKWLVTCGSENSLRKCSSECFSISDFDRFLITSEQKSPSFNDVMTPFQGVLFRRVALNFIAKIGVGIQSRLMASFFRNSQNRLDVIREKAKLLDN